MKLKLKLKKSLAVILSTAMIFSATAVPVMAAAKESVKVELKGKDGTTSELASWLYDTSKSTYIDNATGSELTIVSDWSENPKVYTGMTLKPDPKCLSVATKGIEIEDLLDYASELAGGIDMRGDTGLYLDSDGYYDYFTYDQYWGKDRYYFMDWYNGDEDDFITETGEASCILAEEMLL